jgi:hypothetical protein
LRQILKKGTVGTQQAGSRIGAEKSMKGIVGENHHIGSERHHLWLLEFSECPV